jgi:hypothetical protein
MASRKNSGSPSTTSEPPLASSWAAPPEFYLDENLAGRTLAQALRGLGYVVHTPFELYKGRHKAEGTPDEVWLRDVGQHKWTVIGRDTRILQVPRELDAYKRAQLHMVLYPGQATRQTLVEGLHATLRDVCTASTRGRPGVWRARLHDGRWTLTEL